MNVGSGVVFDKGINMIGPVNLKAAVGKSLIINQFGISLFRQFSPVGPTPNEQVVCMACRLAVLELHCIRKVDVASKCMD